jgi:hypothetical protein
MIIATNGAYLFPLREAMVQFCILPANNENLLSKALNRLVPRTSQAQTNLQAIHANFTILSCRSVYLYSGYIMHKKRHTITK